MIRVVTILFSIWVLIGSIAQAHAADSVGLAAYVVARKSTDTMNDFDFSNLNPDAASANYSGLIKGASTSTKNDPSLKILLFELSAVFIVVLLFYFMRRKQRVFFNFRIEQKTI